MKDLTAVAKLRVVSKQKQKNKEGEEVLYVSLGFVVPTHLLEAMGWESGDQIMLWADPKREVIIAQRAAMPSLGR